MQSPIAFPHGANAATCLQHALGTFVGDGDGLGGGISKAGQWTWRGFDGLGMMRTGCWLLFNVLFHFA